MIMEETAQPGAEQIAYRGKQFSLPLLSADGLHLVPDRSASIPEIPLTSPLVHDLNSIWNLERFLTPRLPITAGTLTAEELIPFAAPGVPRVLDLPIKMPGSDFRLPRELSQFAPAIQKMINYELAINPRCFDEYYAYLTVDQGTIRPGALQREAPCHVDGFQGARWNPKVKINHTYTVSDALPTVFYPQPFDFSNLDESKHNFFWEMNRQVAADNSASAWQGKNGEILLMDAYCVHRGVEATQPTARTWIRLSFETRIFDRLGNAHNPMFSYDWEMVPRDIEQLNLQVYSNEGDPSLYVFPWQAADGSPLPPGALKTRPRLKTEPFEGLTLPELPDRAP